MTQAAEEILQKALELPEEDRDRIADSLWRSVHGSKDDGVEEAWIAEANRRAREIDEGKVKLVPDDKVMARLRSRFVD